VLSVQLITRILRILRGLSLNVGALRCDLLLEGVNINTHILQKSILLSHA